MLFLSVCICDDIESHIVDLKKVIDAWGEKENVEIIYKCYTNPYNFDANDVIENDIVFMDVELGGISGIDIANNIRALGSEMPIVFVSSFKKYMDQCHSIMNLDFLSKPVKSELCDKCLDRALVLRSELETNSIIICKRKIIVERVFYIEAQNHSTIIHYVKEQQPIPKDFSELLSLLPSDRFMKIHKSFAVNIKHIADFRNEVILDNDVSLPISREMRTSARSQFQEYHWRIGNE